MEQSSLAKRAALSPFDCSRVSLKKKDAHTHDRGGGRHTLLIDLPSDLLRVLADRRRIVPVLDNLFSCRLARVVRPRHDARSGFRTWLFFGHVEPGNVRPIPCSRFLGPRARCYTSM